MSESSPLCVGSLPKPWPTFTPAGCDVPEVIGNLSMSLLSETETETCLYYFLTYPRLHSTAAFRVSNDIVTIV
jgi:hypothetical protein